MNQAVILRAAAARVREGWCQYQTTRDGRVCAFGALGVALTGTIQGAFEIWDRYPDEMRALMETVGRARGVEGDSVKSIAKWNDRAGQTAEAVAFTFELAATLVEEEAAVAPLVTA